MFRQILLLFSIIYLATSEINKKIDENIPDQNRMMGIDAVHDNSIKIDKNTIITRNLKLEKRNRGQKAISNKIEEDQEPYWSYESFSTEVAAHVEQFKKNMSECLKEVQSNDKRPLKRLSPKMESPVHEDCLIACVLKRNEIIANGKVNKDNLLSLVSKFYAKDQKLMKKLEKNLDRCIEISVYNQDECKLASKLNDCTNDLMASNKHKVKLENDMENYMRYKIMGSVDRIRLKPNCVPSRFDCHRKDKFASNEYCHLGKAKRLKSLDVDTSKDSVQDLNEEDNDNASSSCNEGLLACYKIACEKCNNDIASGEIHYIAANLGPELLFIFEQEVAHELGSEAAICEGCFNSVMDIIDSIHNITEVIEDNTVEPIRTNNTYACVWCLASLANRRSQHLPNGVHKDAISNLIAPRQIPDGGALCYRCWSRACRMVNVRSSKSGQSQHICVWCKRSLAQRRSHSIPNGPERDVITAKIAPRQIRPLDRVCYACWVSARRIVQRATKPPRNINRNFCVACAISVVKRQTRLLLHGPEKNAISRRIYPRQVSDNSLVCKHCWTWAEDAVRRENEQPVEAVPNEDEPPQVFDMPRNIQLKTYRKVGMSSSSCFVPGCTNTERLLVPRFLRKTLLSNYKIHVTDYARVCLVHKTTSDWDHAFNLEALNCVFSAEEIEKMMEVIK